MFSNANGGAEASVYQRVLGADFARLDPQLQIYFGEIPLGQVGVGVGRYDHAGLRARALWPLFVVAARWGIAFPEYGVGVPFIVRNVQGADGLLRATRSFDFARCLRTMRDAVHVANGRLVDRLGQRGEFEVELSLTVVKGGLRMESRRLALRIGMLRMPLPPVVRVRLDERAASGGRQRVDVRVRMPLVGVIYGYAGVFTYTVRT